MIQIGFSAIRKNLERIIPDEKLLLFVGRIEKINEDSVNFDTEEFRKIAIEYNGEYNAWETPVE